MVRDAVVTILLATLLPPIAGCTGPRSVSLDMFVAESGGRAMLFKLDEAGTLSYGGGADALDGRFSWSGELTHAQVKEVGQLVEPWIEQEPGSTGHPPETRYAVTVVTTQGRRRFQVQGESPELATVRAYLHAITAQRFERMIDALPKAGEQRR